MKMLRASSFLIAFIFCVSGNAFAQRDLPVNDASTAAFIELCKNPDDPEGRSFCFGFGEGVYQAYLSGRSANTKPSICFLEENGTREEILKKFLSWSAKNPQFNKEKAAKTLMRFFTANYACK